jgi:hypothetical protein
MANFMPGFNMPSNMPSNMPNNMPNNVAIPNMMNNYYNSAPSTITGPTGGTSIFELKKSQMGNNHTETSPSYMQGGNGNYTHPSGQPTQSYHHPEYPNHSDTRSNSPEPHDTEDTQNYYGGNTNNMQNIVEDINDAIKHDKRRKKYINVNDSEIEDIQGNEVIEEDTQNKKKKSMKTVVGSFLKEPILLLVLYIILSINPVKNVIGKYIPYINPDENGVVGIMGIASYGLVLVVLFTIIRYFI